MKRLAHATEERVPFRWNAKHVEGRKGDTIAAALYALGIRELARSRKNHRPLGLSGGHLQGVLARAGGRPNVRLDLEPVVAGLDVRMQNVWPGARFDLLSAARLIPARWLRAGFEHTQLMPSGARRFQIWERLLAFLAGMADPPSRDLPASATPGQRLAVDLLVVGGGPAGRKAANEAAEAGKSIALACRGSRPGRFAEALGIALPELDSRVRLFAGLEIFGLYRNGAFALGAPSDPTQGAVIFEPGRILLATGKRSIPPLVPGSHLPGVLEASVALALAHDHGVAPGLAVAVLGTGAERVVAERLARLGVEIVHVGPVAALRRIVGANGVTSIEADRPIACDALVHAGPWRSDPGLGFQAGAEGLRQLRLDRPAERAVMAGSAAAPDEPAFIGRARLAEALLCPCMDVSAGELMDHMVAGESDPEVLKRLTACGMGPCQGFPCWELQAALIAHETGSPPVGFGRPSHRPPRRALTVAQAAGLEGLVAPDR
jgi:sarcosine oxidase subunit alpha